MTWWHGPIRPAGSISRVTAHPGGPSSTFATSPLRFSACSKLQGKPYTTRFSMLAALRKTTASANSLKLLPRQSLAAVSSTLLTAAQTNAVTASIATRFTACCLVFARSGRLARAHKNYMKRIERLGSVFPTLNLVVIPGLLRYGSSFKPGNWTLPYIGQIVEILFPQSLVSQPFRPGIPPNIGAYTFG